MKFVAALLFLLVGTQYSYAQSIDAIVKEGVAHHDAGDYDAAIQSYKMALVKEPDNTLVNYEIALTYFTIEKYEKAIEHTDVVLEQNADYLVYAYVTKGNALDMLGKTDESVKLFKKAIKKTEGHYLLNYNLALNYYKLKKNDDAAKQLIEAINLNSNHSSSHLLLALIQEEKGKTVQTLLALHYFLLLEPDSQRALQAYGLLMEKFGGNVEKGDDNTITISVSPDLDSEFGAAEMMLGMMTASNSLEDNKDKTEDQLFIENTTSFFKILGELREDKSKGIWWELYVDFFYRLADSDHMETYCMFISLSGNERAPIWFGENEDKIDSFIEWIKKN